MRAMSEVDELREIIAAYRAGHQGRQIDRVRALIEPDTEAIHADNCDALSWMFVPEDCNCLVSKLRHALDDKH